jgi:hypothetical protein
MSGFLKSVLNPIGSLFGQKSGSDPVSDLTSQTQAIRDAADKQAAATAAAAQQQKDAADQAAAAQAQQAQAAAAAAAQSQTAAINQAQVVNQMQSQAAQDAASAAQGNTVQVDTNANAAAADDNDPRRKYAQQGAAKSLGATGGGAGISLT